MKQEVHAACQLNCLGKAQLHFTFRILQLDDNIVLENVDLLNARNSVHSNSLQSALKTLVISGCGLVDCLLLPANSVSSCIISKQIVSKLY
jgi:hypothetical protein